MDSTDGRAGRAGALLQLLAVLKARGYRFVTPGNETIRTVRDRPDKASAKDLRDVFGWSLPFHEALLDREVLALMRSADILQETDGGFRSSLRVSSVGDSLFLHSAFPTTSDDAVFFGPDTYRFIRFLRERLPEGALGRVVDVGAGSGPGGIMVGRMRSGARIVLADVNRAALDLARVNARANGVACECVEGTGLEPSYEAPDLVISNPPFIADQGQLYQGGGDAFGTAVSYAWARDAVRRLKPGGRLLLYTGSAIVGGDDPFRGRLEQLAAEHGRPFDYEEIDPDIFGSELQRPAYAEVERIAAVGAVIGPAA